MDRKNINRGFKIFEFGKMLFPYISWPVKIDPNSLDSNTDVMQF